MERFIDPKTLARVKDLPLVAQTVADGFLHGMQSSMQRGVGIEFSQYRAYETGDELSRIDWKLFARSDRYFVREAERESEINVWLIMDASRSMLQKSQPQKNTDHNRWDKLEYAKHLVASISYIAQKQGDSIGYLGMSSDALNFLVPGNSDKHWRKILQQLTLTQPGSYFADIERLRHHINHLQKPSLIFVISDFNQRNNEIIDFVAKLNTAHCEVVALQLVCDDEIDFSYKGAIRFKDLETGEEVLVSAGSARAAYQDSYQKYQQKLIESLAQKNVFLKSFNIDEPLDQVLFEYLKQRQKIGR